MGIHSGPINEIIDVNDRANVTGAGIDLAPQRGHDRLLVARREVGCAPVGDAGQAGAVAADPQADSNRKVRGVRRTA